MDYPINVYKGRTTIVPVSLGIDVSGDTITCVIGNLDDSSHEDYEILAEWVVAFETDGTDGELILTMDDAEVAAVTAITGWMDMKRVSGGEPLPVFEKPLEVIFRGTVTA